MAPLAGLIGHGGTVGLIAEASIAVAVTAVFVAVWLRERSAKRSRRPPELSDLEDR